MWHYIRDDISFMSFLRRQESNQFKTKDAQFPIYIGWNNKNIIDIIKLKAYLSNKPGSSQDYPFGPETLVYKVLGKMFALFGEDDKPIRMNLKCDPDDAIVLRDMFESVIPGYHMNKEHWNTVILNGSIPESEIRKMIDESYRLVAKSLKKADRDRLKL